MNRSFLHRSQFPIHTAPALGAIAGGKKLSFILRPGKVPTLVIPQAGCAPFDLLRPVTDRRQKRFGDFGSGDPK